MNFLRRHFIKIGLAVIILGLLIVVISKLNPKNNKDSEKSAQAASTSEQEGQDQDNANKSTPKATAVSIETVKLADLNGNVEFEGEVSPSRYTTIRASQAGYVERILINEGDYVQKGRALIYIDKILSENRVKLALNNLKNALLDVYQTEIELKSAALNLTSLEKQKSVLERQLENETMLFDEGLSSQLKLDQVTSQYQSLEANYQREQMNLSGLGSDDVRKLNLRAQAQAQLAKNKDIAALVFKHNLTNPPLALVRNLNRFETAKVNYRLAKNDYDRSLGKAPFKGRVLRRLVDNGQYVNPGEGLFVFGNLDELEINVYLTAADANALGKNPAVVVTFDSLPGVSIKGQLRSIAWDADPVNKGYRAAIKIRNLQNKIRSKDRARVKLAVYELESQISVPLSALLQGTDGPYVYLVDDQSRAKRQFVETGAILSGRVQVTKGLAVGDQVVVKSQQYLKDNDLLVVK